MVCGTTWYTPPRWAAFEHSTSVDKENERKVEISSLRVWFLLRRCRYINTSTYAIFFFFDFSETRSGLHVKRTSVRPHLNIWFSVRKIVVLYGSVASGMHDRQISRTSLSPRGNVDPGGGGAGLRCRQHRTKAPAVLCLFFCFVSCCLFFWCDLGCLSCACLSSSLVWFLACRWLVGYVG